MRTLLSGIFLLSSLASFGQGDIYWTQGSASPKIMRCDLNGNNVTPSVETGLTAPGGVAIDTANSHIYWVDAGAQKIQRANLGDGSNVTDLVTGLSQPYGSAFDVKGGKMYWTDYGTQKLQELI